MGCFPWTQKYYRVRPAWQLHIARTQYSRTLYNSILFFGSSKETTFMTISWDVAEKSIFKIYNHLNQDFLKEAIWGLSLIRLCTKRSLLMSHFFFQQNGSLIGTSQYKVELNKVLKSPRLEMEKWCKNAWLISTVQSSLIFSWKSVPEASVQIYIDNVPQHL